MTGMGTPSSHSNMPLPIMDSSGESRGVITTQRRLNVVRLVRFHPVERIRRNERCDAVENRNAPLTHSRWVVGSERFFSLKYLSPSTGRSLILARERTAQ